MFFKMDVKAGQFLSTCSLQCVFENLKADLSIPFLHALAHPVSSSCSLMELLTSAGVNDKNLQTACHKLFTG